jgi:FtsP/CotA-like multicopper oxidase with cupredoxin domain
MRTFLILCAFAAGCTSPPPSDAVMCATDDLAAPADVTIHARDAVIEPMAGDDFIAWTYDGDVPGPILRMNLGDTRRIKLVNDSPRATSLHFHGVFYSNADDGSEDQPESVVQPGCAHVYTLTATQPGVWPYHGHVDARTSMARGQIGAVIVPDPAELPAAHDFVILLHSLGIEGQAAATGSGDGDPGEGGGNGPRSFFQVINGRPYGAAEVIELDANTGRYVATQGTKASARLNERVRFRVANLSPDDVHTFHIHGHRWCANGGSLSGGTTCPGNTPAQDNLTLGPSIGTTVEFVEDNPGEWMLHCHVQDHVNDGMIAYYDVSP